MPSEYVRPKPSKVPPLGDDAKAAYEALGWKITPNGGVDMGQHDGPCALCRKRTTLYGPFGSPLCEDCDPRPGKRAKPAPHTPGEESALLADMKPEGTQ